VEEGVVISFARIHRVTPAAVVRPPVTIVLVRELGGTVSYMAPLEDDDAGLRIGEAVRLVKRTWFLSESPGTFAGLVAYRRQH
jgi:uncharacterized OB-fold protein